MPWTQRLSWIAGLVRRKPSSGAPAVDPLTKLAIKHGTDKWGPHFYTPIYHALFSGLRDKPVRLLEIGVGGYRHADVGGASLAMWAEYFPRGRIVGIDVAEKRLQLDPRVVLRRGSQDDAVFLRSLCDELGPFDIVIDDGSHFPEHVVASFNTLFPLLGGEALYVIEDTQTGYWPEFRGSVDGGGTVRLANAILENLNHAEIKVAFPDRQIPEICKSIRSLRAYHNLLIIEKGDNTEPSNGAYTLDNPHAASALRMIERQLAKEPTPAGYANLVEIHAIAGDLATASAVARDALARWPSHLGLLHTALAVAERNDDQAWQRECRARLDRLGAYDSRREPRMA